MPEQFIHSQQPSGPDRIDEPDSSSDDGAVTVIHGIHAHSQPLAGRSIRRARAEVSERLQIPPDAVAVIDGDPIDDEDQVLVEGQTLNFVKHAGEKGSRSLSGHFHQVERRATGGQ